MTCCGFLLALLLALPLHAQQENALQKSPLEVARAHLKADRDAQAEKLLSGFLHSHPNDPDAAEAFLLLGRALEKQSRIDESLRTFSGLVSRFPGTEFAARALAAQARICSTRNASDAQRHLDVLLKRYPDSPTTAKVWIAEADGLYDKQKLDEAIVIYRKFKAALPPVSKRKYEVAELLRQSDGDPAKLLALATRILDEDNFLLARVLLERLAASSAAARHLPEIKTKLA